VKSKLGGYYVYTPFVTDNSYIEYTAIEGLRHKKYYCWIKYKMSGTLLIFNPGLSV